jgi:molybdopterin converting factor small subunit
MSEVRFWAGARTVAGTTQEAVAPGPLPEVIGGLIETHGERMRSLLACSVLLLDGAQVERDAAVTVADDSVLEVLPPYAGG